MTKYSESLHRDANRSPLANTSWAYDFRATKTITFDGGTANAIGDHDGTGDPFDIFTVTGEVMMHVFAVCETTLTSSGSPTLEVGTANNTAEIIPQISDATGIAKGELWHDANCDSNVENSSDIEEKMVVAGAAVVGTVGTANITGGSIKVYCYWKPLSSDGDVSAA